MTASCVLLEFVYLLQQHPPTSVKQLLRVVVVVQFIFYGNHARAHGLVDKKLIIIIRALLLDSVVIHS